MTSTTLPPYGGAGRLYTGGAVFLLGSIALVVDTGYSYGSALLLFGGLYAMFTGPSVEWRREDWWVVGILVGFGLTGVFDALIHDAGGRAVDKPIRFILAPIALVMVRRFPPRLEWLWAGLAVGGILTAFWAGYQKFFLDVERAGGHTYVIQFGNIAMLTGIFCLAAVGWARQQRHSHAWTLLLICGAVGGILGSLLSGSRGGWVGFPLVLWVLYRAYRDFLSTRLRVSSLIAVVVAGILVYSVPHFGVQQRVQAAFNDIALYRDGNSETSLGARFEMWQGATKLFLQKPIIGWGGNNYDAAMRELVDAGEAHPFVTNFGHPHNEILDAAAKRGLVGLVALLALYLVPLRLFAGGLQSPDLTQRSLATAGTLLSVAYIDFGLSQAFFAHNSGVMIYAFWLIVLWGCYRNAGGGISKHHSGAPPTR